MKPGPRPRRALDAEQRDRLVGLLQEFGPRLLTYVRRAYGDAFEAEEIVAETFARAAENMPALLAASRPELYLLTIARNLCRDGFRRRRPDSLANDDLCQRPSATADAAAAMTESEEFAALHAAVAALPDGLREVLVLRLTAGLKFEEIAELLNIPLGTALSRMHAAVERLRRELGCRADV